MKKFLYYSKILGSDFMLCQGPGGNTSYKQGRNIFIKKSGFHLSESNENSFLKINFTKILDFYKNNPDHLEKYENSLSIETPLHVLSKAKYVFHFHSIASIICSLLYKKSDLDKLLIKEKILPISYIRPGLELAEEVNLLNNHGLYSNFFLYNHGMVVEGDDLIEINNRIYMIENFFKKLIDYEKLKSLSNKIYKINQKDFKINNPDPDLKYELYNNKFFFPDHAVFFPHQINKIESSEIHYDDKNIHFRKKLSDTELTYFKTLLIIFCYIKNEKIHNYIDLKTSKNLRNSEDELLRVNLNK
jgi:ribulose-5-phosphate 4-epimerase/fuculose-1-phosphate aldolase